MTDISVQGAVLTIGGSRFGSVSFSDLSDDGTPIEFGELDGISVESDLNHNLMVSRRNITPAFTISLIPNSESCKELIALLRSSVVGTGIGSSASLNDIYIPEAMLRIPCFDGTVYFTFYEGYLVGGSSCLNVSGDGRMQSGRFRFVFKSVNNGGDSNVKETVIYNGSEEMAGLYYASVSASSTERLISHPIETGGVIYDQKFREPEKINVSVRIPLSAPSVNSEGERTIVTAANVVKKLKTMLDDRSVGGGRQSSDLTPYSIVTKTEEYRNLSLIAISHDEKPDQFDLVEYRLTFQELMFSRASGQKSVSDPSNTPMNPTQPKSAQSLRPTA